MEETNLEKEYNENNIEHLDYNVALSLYYKKTKNFQSIKANQVFISEILALLVRKEMKSADRTDIQENYNNSHFIISDQLNKAHGILKMLGSSTFFYKRKIFCMVLQNLADDISPSIFGEMLTTFSNLVLLKDFSFQITEIVKTNSSHIINLPKNKDYQVFMSNLLKSYHILNNTAAIELIYLLEDHRKADLIELLLDKVSYRNYKTIYSILNHSEKTRYNFKDTIFTIIYSRIENNFFSTSKDFTVKSEQVLLSKILWKLFEQSSSAVDIKINIDKKISNENIFLSKIYLVLIKQNQIYLTADEYNKILTKYPENFIHIFDKLGSSDKIKLLRLIFRTKKLYDDSKIVRMMTPVFLKYGLNHECTLFVIKSNCLEILVEIFSEFDEKTILRFESSKNKQFFYKEYVNFLLILLESGITSSKVKTRKLSLRLIDRQFSLFSSCELIYLLKIFWYFILDVDLIQEFNLLIRKYTLKNLDINWAEYLLCGLMHQAKKVRDRYKEIYLLIFDGRDMFSQTRKIIENNI